MKTLLTRKIFWIILTLLHVVFMGKQLFIHQTMLQDSKEYLYAAKNIIDTQTLYSWDLKKEFNPDYLTKRPFLYPFIIAIVKLISLQNSFWFLFLILAIQNCISLYCFSALEKILKVKKLLPNYFLMLVLILFTPAQLIYANLIMSEIWLEFILILILLILILKPLNVQNIILLALLAIAAISLKPVMLFLTIALPLLTLVLSKQRRVLIISLSLIPLIFAYTISKLNQSRTGYFQYSSISTYNLLHYNTYSLLIHTQGITKADAIIDSISAEAALKQDYSYAQNMKAVACKDLIYNHFFTYTYLHTRGILFCLLDPGRFDIIQFFDLPHQEQLVYETSKQNNFTRLLNTFFNPFGLVLGVLFLVNMLKILAILRFLFSKSISLIDKFLISFIPIGILLLTGPIGSSRFGLPFFPILVLAILLQFGTTKNEINS